jgi:hypothetical protein
VGSKSKSPNNLFYVFFTKAFIIIGRIVNYITQGTGSPPPPPSFDKTRAQNLKSQDESSTQEGGFFYKKIKEGIKLVTSPRVVLRGEFQALVLDLNYLLHPSNAVSSKFFTKIKSPCENFLKIYKILCETDTQFR